MLISERGLCVVHAAGMEDLNALTALSHTTHAIAALGVDQVVLALEDRTRSYPTWKPPAAVEVRPVRYSGLSWVHRTRALESEFTGLFRQRAPYAVHLHGLMACLLGSRALKRAMLRGRVICSPHPTPSGPPWVTDLLGRLLRSQLSTLNYAPLAASLADAQVLSRLFNRSAAVAQQPVSALFFSAARHEAHGPELLADGVGAEAVDRVTRLGVLLNGRGARVGFAWLGTAQGRMRAQLEAANIRLLGAADDSDRAGALSRAWLFVQMSRHDPWPLGVAQAMAAGVPCLVSDIPTHRALIHPGETGFVCTTERDLLESVLLLLRDRTERKRIGEAARAEAMRRFTEQDFQRALLRAYGFSMDPSAIRAPGRAATSANY